jgi:hypothetical protein
MDMSMRSSGIIAMTPRNEIIGFEAIKTSLDEFPEHEDMIIYVVGKTINFIEEFHGDKFVIEGLSHAGKSASKDVIAGLFWSIRMTIRQLYPEMPIGVIPVTSWRAPVLKPAEVKEAKTLYSPKKDAIKIATAKKLPDDIREWFDEYITCSGYKKETLYDLTDAYFLAKYRNSLGHQPFIGGSNGRK